MKKTLILAILLIVAVAVLLVMPFVGMRMITVGALLDSVPSGIERDILWRIRIPRVCTAFLAGAALSLSGMTFQAMFRNPLATPFTLGVSSGAALGAALSIHLGLTFSFLGLGGTTVCAFAGATAAILVVYGITRVKRGFSTATMLLAGVAMSFFFSSVILFTQYVSGLTHSFRIVRWMMGGIDVVGFAPLWQMLPFVLIGSVIILALPHELNLLLTGEELALSRGVRVEAIKKVLFFATSLMVGGVVAICGPIGFVGMMVPHICRLLIGWDHRSLTPASLLFGGVFLTICDTVSRTIIAPAEIPVGVITALLGGPFFIWLLLSGSSEKSIL